MGLRMQTPVFWCILMTYILFVHLTGLATRVQINNLAWRHTFDKATSVSLQSQCPKLCTATILHNNLLTACMQYKNVAFPLQELHQHTHSDRQ